MPPSFHQAESRHENSNRLSFGINTFPNFLDFLEVKHAKFNNHQIS